MHDAELTCRISACRDIAEDRQTLELVLKLFGDIEASATMSTILFPWFPGTLRLWLTISAAPKLTRHSCWSRAGQDPAHNQRRAPVYDSQEDCRRTAEDGEHRAGNLCALARHHAHSALICLFVQDPLQFLIDEGDSMVQIIEFLIGSLFAGLTNSGRSLLLASDR